MRKHLSNFLKLLVTVAALWWVFTEIDLEAFTETLVTANLWWVFAGFMLFNLGLFIRAVRWWVLLRGLGANISLWRLTDLYFVGNFFNMALPSGFGGDVVRVMEIARDVPTDVATGTVVLDRLTGLVVLFLVALLALPGYTAVLPPIVIWITAVFAIAGVIGMLLLMDGRLIRRFGSWLPKPLNPNEDGTVGKLFRAMQGCGWTAVLQAMAISVIFSVVLPLWWLTSGIALGYTVSYQFYLLIMPMVALPLLIPSIGGLGPRELIVQELFPAIGVSPESGVAISLVVFIITRLSGFLGAPLYLASLVRNTMAKRNATAPVETAEQTD